MVCVVFCLPYFYSPTKKTSIRIKCLAPSLKTFPLRNGSLKNLEQKRQQLEALLQAADFGGEDFGLVISRCSSTGCMKTDGKYKDKPAASVQTVELAGVQAS